MVVPRFGDVNPRIGESLFRELVTLFHDVVVRIDPRFGGMLYGLVTVTFNDSVALFDDLIGGIIPCW